MISVKKKLKWMTNKIFETDNLNLLKFIGEKGLRILFYHGVRQDNVSAGSILNYDGKHVGIKKFDKQIRYLRKNYDIISLSEALSLLQSGKKNYRALVITFDDGYSGVYDLAFPLLKQYGMTASVFLTAGHIGSDRWIWSDELEYLLDVMDREYISLDIANENIEFKMVPLQNRISTAIKLKGILRSSNKADRGKIMEQIYNLSGRRNTEKNSSMHSLMSWPQAKEMAEAGFEMGAHSIYHHVLTCMDRKEIATELRESKKVIEQNTGIDVKSFSYPNGEYNQEIMDLVRTCGYSCALSVDYGLNNPGIDVYSLKRMAITDNYSDTFFYLFLHPRLYGLAGRFYKVL